MDGPLYQNVGYVLLYMFSLHLPWRPLAALLLAFPAIALACLLPLPETPYWLVRWDNYNFNPFYQTSSFFLLTNPDPICRQGRLEEAKQSLAWLREGEHYLEEQAEILEVADFKVIPLYKIIIS